MTEPSVTQGIAPAEVAGIRMHLEGHVAHAVVGRLAVSVDAFAVAGKDDDVVLVHLADRLVQRAHDDGEIFRRGAPRLIQDAVAGHRAAILVAQGDLLPQPDGALLVFRAVPVFVPARAAAVMLPALAADGAVQIENHVDAALLGFIGGKSFEENHTLAFIIAFVTAFSITALIELIRWALKHARYRQTA